MFGSPTRREFLALSLAGAAVASAGTSALAGAMWRSAPRKKLRILILGGTGFLGPAMVEAAHAAGHELTLFNRGKREKVKGTSYDFVTKLYGNRDPEKRADDADEKSPKGLEQIAQAIKDGAKWDVVIDNSGFVPRVVKASATLLAPAAERYIFISSVSVYAKNDAPGADESAELSTMEDPTVESMGASFENYGPLKVLCEKAAGEAFPGRCLSIRPGYIVGVRDDTDRFTYWPVRMSQGGTMLVPGESTDPVQFVDVRDLAEFAVRCAETGQTGAMNVTGPVKPITWGATMNACAEAVKAVGKTPAEQEWVPGSFLRTHGAGEGVLPIWIPPEGEYAGFHLRSIAKAVAAGFTTRPPVETCRSILEWWPGELERRARVTAEMKAQAAKDGKPEPKMADPTQLRAGLPSARETEIVAAWQAEQKKSK